MLQLFVFFQSCVICVSSRTVCGSYQLRFCSPRYIQQSLAPRQTLLPKGSSRDLWFVALYEEYKNEDEEEEEEETSP